MKLVKTEIQKSMNLESQFDRKKEKIDHLFNNYKFHPIEDYDNYMLMRNYKKKEESSIEKKVIFNYYTYLIEI